MIKLTILTPHSKLESEDVKYIKANSFSQGIIGIEKNRAPILISLATSILEFETEISRTSIVIENGFLSFEKNICKVLCENFHLAINLDAQALLARKTELMNQVKVEVNNIHIVFELDLIEQQLKLLNS